MNGNYRTTYSYQPRHWNGVEPKSIIPIIKGFREVLVDNGITGVGLKITKEVVEDLVASPSFRARHRRGDDSRNLR